MIFPSFGSDPGATNVTPPRSFVSACSVAATAPASASPGAAVSACSVRTSCSPSRLTTRRSATSSRWRRADLDDLAGMDEQAPDLGRLVGAAHPALETAGRRPGREVPGAEAKQGIVAGEFRDDDLADPAGGRWLAGSRRDDLNDQFVIDQQAGHQLSGLVVRLPGDDPEIGGGVGLAGLDTGSFQLRPQARRQGRAGNEGFAIEETSAPVACALSSTIFRKSGGPQ